MEQRRPVPARTRHLSHATRVPLCARCHVLRDVLFREVERSHNKRPRTRPSYVRVVRPLGSHPPPSLTVPGKLGCVGLCWTVPGWVVLVCARSCRTSGPGWQLKSGSIGSGSAVLLFRIGSGRVIPVASASQRQSLMANSRLRYSVGALDDLGDLGIAGRLSVAAAAAAAAAAVVVAELHICRGDANAVPPGRPCAVLGDGML